jgi:hypothetical protein
VTRLHIGKAPEDWPLQDADAEFVDAWSFRQVLDCASPLALSNSQRAPKRWRFVAHMPLRRSSESPHVISYNGG